MKDRLGPTEIGQIAPLGYYLALRVGFAFPMEEVNALPTPWVEHYTRNRFMLSDPVIRWIYANTGAIRWSEISFDDPRGILTQARQFGLQFGVAIAVFDNNSDGQRSFGTFVRADREFDDGEVHRLHAYVARLHNEKAPHQPDPGRN